MLAGQSISRDVIETNHVNELIEFARENQVGLIVIDPYIGFHRASENDNTQQDEVIAILRRICSETDAAVLVVAHTRKTGGDSETHAGDAESMRGASSIAAGARVVITVASMNSKTANNWKIDDDMRRQLVRLDDGKKNFSPMDDKAHWVYLQSQHLPCGDYIGVPYSFDNHSHG
jgi:RecA-family ATPase